MPNPPATGLPHPARYQPNSKGVVLDAGTGLMWQRGVDAKSYSWPEAAGYCQRLELAGYDDWRLPSRIELLSIVDLTRSRPSIDGVAFPHTPSDWFWTSSPEAGNPAGGAWYVYFYFGYPKVDPTNTPYRARCVRTAESPRPGVEARSPPAAGAAGAGAGPFYDIQRDVVRDRGTGLTWQRAVPPRTFSFEDAGRYCAALRLGKDKGWRVPSMGELQTIVDERASSPTIDARAFPKTPSDSFWTSSLFADSSAMAWHVYFEFGNALYGLLKGPHRVRCVR